MGGATKPPIAALAPLGPTLTPHNSASACNSAARRARKPCSAPVFNVTTCGATTIHLGTPTRVSSPNEQ